MAWTVFGRLRVAISETALLPSPFTVTADLERAEVEVLGSTLNSGGFATWGTAFTTAEGRFTVAQNVGDAPRRIKVRVRFRDSKLKVTAPSPYSDWCDIFESPEKVDGPNVDIGTCTIADRDGGDLQALDNYRRAATWYICKTIMKELEAHDSAFAFKDHVTIVYPARTVGASYANGIERMVYIKWLGKNDQWDIPTIIHEFMHIWNYDHNHGMTDWLGAVICSFSTHNFQEQPAVAFHEGFAEYAKDSLLQHIWGFSRIEPKSRTGLKGFKNGAATPLDNLEMLEKNEDGVLNALHLLSTPDIYTRVFGTPNAPLTSNTAGTKTPIKGRICPKAPTIDFWDVLSVFKPNADAGWPTAWEAKPSSGILRFYDRAADILPEFDEETKKLYLELLNRISKIEPQDKCKPFGLNNP